MSLLAVCKRGSVNGKKFLIEVMKDAKGKNKFECIAFRGLLDN